MTFLSAVACATVVALPKYGIARLFGRRSPFYKDAARWIYATGVLLASSTYLLFDTHYFCHEGQALRPAACAFAVLVPPVIDSCLVLLLAGGAAIPVWRKLCFAALVNVPHLFLVCVPVAHTCR